MKALVVYPTLNRVGGADRVCLAAVEALRGLGFEVGLLTWERTDWGLVERMLGPAPRPHAEHVAKPIGLPIGAIYGRLATRIKVHLKAKLLRRLKGYDLVVNMNANTLPIPADISYIHFPTFAVKKEEKYEHGLWRLYHLPYSCIHKRLVKGMLGGLIMANSSYTARVVKETLGARPAVVYPPVDIERFLPLAENDEREDLVVAVGRYVPEKRHDFVLRLASKLRDVKFIIIGSARNPLSDKYYDRLMRLKRELSLHNVELIRDAPLDVLLDVLSRAKVLIHPMVGEHFGIAVVEGMAAGLVPVVHRSGGPWEDIIDHGKYGYGFSDFDEAVEAVIAALDMWRWKREAVVRRAQEFSKERFIATFKSLVADYIDGDPGEALDGEAEALVGVF